MNNNELFPLATDQPQAKNLGQQIGHYARYWYWFALSIGLCLGVAYAYLKYYAVPEYAIISTLLIKEDGGESPMSSESFDLNLFASSKNLNNEIEVLESTSLMERVVTALGLTTTYHQVGRFRNVELYGNELPIRVVTDRLAPSVTNQDITVHLKSGNVFELEENGRATTYSFGQQIRRPYADFTVVADSNAQRVASYVDSRIIVGLHNLRNMAAGYRQRIKIEPVSKESTVLRVSMADALPQRGRDMIDKLVEMYNQEALEDKNQMATNTIHFLDDRLRFLT
ncbi:MAG: capsular biosynthesis protein, partial [Hymenobacter sp.]